MRLFQKLLALIILALLPITAIAEPILESAPEIPKTKKVKKSNHIFRDENIILKRDGFLINQNGDKVTMEQFRGKIVLLDFIYTTCKYGHCQYLSKKMEYLAKRFIDSVGTEIQLVSVTFDPEYDTAEVLKKYSADYEMDSSRWVFLTGQAGDIVDLAEKYGIIFRWNKDDGSFNHSMRTILLDRSGQTVGIYRGMNYKLQNAIDGIQALLDGKELKPVDMSVPSGIPNSTMMPAE